MFTPDLLAGKRALITGGGTGLGRAMAERFLQLGARSFISAVVEPAFWKQLPSNWKRLVLAGSTSTLAMFAMQRGCRQIALPPVVVLRVSRAASAGSTQWDIEHIKGLVAAIKNEA